MSLKSKNSSGYDEISTKILKISCPYISSPLNYICSKVLSMGIFPDRLKYSIIKPFYVIGNKRGMSVVRMGVQDPEVTSRSRDVNKDGGRVNDFTPPLPPN